LRSRDGHGPELIVRRRSCWQGVLADGRGKKVQRGNLDGTGAPEDLFTGADGLVFPTRVALDVAGGKVYWTDRATHKVQRGNLDGTGAPEDLFTGADGLVFPSGVALDVAAGKVYWTDRATHKVQRGNLDGTGAPEDLFTGADGLVFPYGVALDVPLGLSVSVTMTRGMAAAEQQEWDLAIKYFSEARKAAPTWPSAQFNLALAYDSAGGRELNAIAWYRAYLASAPNAANAQQVRAQIVKLKAERH